MCSSKVSSGKILGQSQYAILNPYFAPSYLRSALTGWKWGIRKQAVGQPTKKLLIGDQQLVIVIRDFN